MGRIRRRVRSDNACCCGKTFPDRSMGESRPPQLRMPQGDPRASRAEGHRARPLAWRRPHKPCRLPLRRHQGQGNPGSVSPHLRRGQPPILRPSSTTRRVVPPCRGLHQGARSPPCDCGGRPPHLQRTLQRRCDGTRGLPGQGFWRKCCIFLGAPRTCVSPPGQGRRGGNTSRPRLRGRVHH